VTVFLTTHNLLEAEKVCDRVAVVRSGRLLAQGRPEEIRGGGPRRMEIVGHGFTPALRARLEALPGVVGLSGDDGPLLVELEPEASGSGVVRTLVEGGAEVESARTVRESLEESFLALLAEEGS
jgi:ABC-2 type transport system ATP-binding protein